MKTLNWALYAIFLVSNQDQASALKVVYIFKVFGGSKLVNGCVAVWLSNICLQGM